MHSFFHLIISSQGAYVIGALFVLWLIFSYQSAPSKAGLCKLPGPRVARYSNFWRLRTSNSGFAPQKFRELHRKYGDVVRIGPNHVSISDPSLIPIIYGVSSKFIKSSFYETLTPHIDGAPLDSIFSTKSQSRHRSLKSGVAQKYSLSSLIRLEPLIDEVTQSFTRHIRRHANESSSVDLGEWLQFYAFDVIGAITFSKTFGFSETGRDFNGVIEGLEFGLKYAAVVGQVPSFHKWLLGNTLLNKFASSIPALRSKDPVQIVHGMIKDALRVADGSKGTTESEDFLTFLKKQNKKDETKMSERDMVNHMFVNLLAGSDTTAISLRAIFYYLIKNPSCMARLLHEIQAADFAGLLSQTITYTESLNHIPYLSLVIKESLRLHPAVPLNLERVVPEGGVNIHGHHLHAGTIVGMNAWVLHNDKEVFGTDAHEFRPDRWEETDDPNQRERLKIMERSFFAFGHGSRTCIGKNISLLEMSKFVPQLLREFKLEWAADEDWTIQSTWFAKQSGFMARIADRDYLKAHRNGDS
ncbi:hypothetical protein VTL71DRAFT_10011 [Oculimacula yallundae]|uniref:Cytochrome P450 n=1 Tax=Oculimacula yallundae TaxID=86028 RepID=A0ABR4BRJ5_9HELO